AMSVLAVERSPAPNRHEICHRSSLRAVESRRAVAHAESTRFNPAIVSDPGLRNLRKICDNRRRRRRRHAMEFIIATCVLLALVIGLAALGVLKEYNVEFTFHP